MTTEESESIGDANTTNNVETLETIEKKRNHPLYLHLPDTPGCVLTTVKLTGMENYSLWSRSMLINLQAKSKVCFVLGTLSKELLSGIVYANDAATVWSDLKERFDKVDGSRIYQLHREICTIHQGNLIVSGYFTTLRLLWDEFNAFVPPPSCNCDKSRIYVDQQAYLRLFAFLMGLNDGFGQARSQILMMNPLPNVSKAYAMIVANEGQRMTAGTQSRREIMEPTALYAGRGNFQRNNHTGRGNMQRNNMRTSQLKKKIGIKYVILQAVGKKEGQGVRSQEVSALAAQPTFTQGQYQKILHMIDKQEVGTLGTNIAGITGIIDTTLSVNSIVKEGRIIDSGATCHMTHNLHRLHSDDDHKELSEKMNDMETIIPQEQTFREINMHNDSAWNEGNEDVGDIDMINEGAEKNVDISVPDIIT
ncbi:uncharacterized protein [Solanum lycopersicum]|uniref:uncharacterized protein n=1 Tax=Solanum lycopersicum TaxID=4081 RepID=UPI000532F23B|nr:uncharacterized protein LOC101268148 [Solanum lycopersicum]